MKEVIVTIIVLTAVILVGLLIIALVRAGVESNAAYDAKNRAMCAAAQQALARIQLNDPDDFQIVLKLYTDEGCR